MENDKNTLCEFTPSDQSAYASKLSLSRYLPALTHSFIRDCPFTFQPINLYASKNNRSPIFRSKDFSLIIFIYVISIQRLDNSYIAKDVSINYFAVDISVFSSCQENSCWFSTALKINLIPKDKHQVKIRKGEEVEEKNVKRGKRRFANIKCASSYFLIEILRSDKMYA